VGRAADVALVGVVDGPERETLADEHRQQRGQVGQVVASVVRIVQQIHVAGAYASLEVLGDRLDGPRQRAHVDGHVLGLRRQASFAVEDRRGEIPARVEDLRVGGAEHGLAHLLHDGLEAVLDDRDGDAVESHDGHMLLLLAVRLGSR
jgi:hypothetical protein